MAVPRRVDDGNITLALETKREMVFPFALRAGSSSLSNYGGFEAHISYNQDKDAYFLGGQPSLMSSIYISGFGTAYLVDPGNPRDAGDNCFDWTRIYASLPATRMEGASVTLTEQWYRATVSGGGDDDGPDARDKYFYDVDYDIEEQQFTVSGQVTYEYFLSQPDPLYKYRVYLLYETLQFVGTPPLTGDTLIVVDDSKVDIYKAGIWVRQTTYAYRK